MKQLLVLLLLLCAANVSAQDVIVKKDGSTILSKVLEVGQTEIKYKRFDNQDGPTYTIGKSELQAINYQNGAKDTFSEYVREENKYLPNNQNEGTQRYNDNALFIMDYSQSGLTKKLKTWGWISGIAGVGIGVFTMVNSLNSNSEGRTSIIPVGGLLALGCMATSVYCFVKAHKHQKQIENMMQSSSIFHQDFKLENGSTLSLSTDLLRDCTQRNNTLGLGLRYSF